MKKSEGYDGLIMTMYADDAKWSFIAYFGDGYYDVSSASEGYFGKEPEDMTEYESTLLAGIPNAPSVYAPTKNPDLAAKRQLQVIRRMVACGYFSDEETEAVSEYIRESRTCVEGLAGYLRERGDDVQKVTVNFVENPDGTRRDYEKVAAIVQEFPEFAVVSGGMGNVEITARSASKGEGLARLGEMLGIGSEEILAFGDSGNDVSMLRMAGVGVAMENGEPEAKEAADFVTKKNTEDGVVYAIEKFVPELAQCASEKEERA